MNRNYAFMGLPILLIVGFVIYHLGSQPDDLDLFEIQYVMTWDRELDSVDALVGEGEYDNWTVTSDLGYDIQITDGILVTAGLQLVSCDDTPDNLLSIFPRVHAEHGDISDPSELPYYFVERFGALEPVESESIQIESPDYCSAHYWLGRADDDFQGFDSNRFDPTTVTLALEGFYQKDNSELIPFSFQTDYSFSEFKVPDDIQAIFYDSESPVTIHVIRDLTQIFNGINMTQIDDPLVQNRVVRNLVSFTEITFDPHE